MVVVAAKVTGIPSQTGLADGEIKIFTGESGLTVMVTVFEVAGFPVGQMALDMIMQVTASLFDGE